MQLTLPSEETGKTKAWLLLEQGDLAGKRYELTASICRNPVCECGIVSLRCTPVARESQPRSKRLLDLLGNGCGQKANRQSGGANPKPGYGGWGKCFFRRDDEIGWERTAPPIPGGQTLFPRDNRSGSV